MPPPLTRLGPTDSPLGQLWDMWQCQLPRDPSPSPRLALGVEWGAALPGPNHNVRGQGHIHKPVHLSASSAGPQGPHSTW